MNLQHESLLHRTRRQFLGDASMGLGAAAMASMMGGNAFADVAFDSTEPLAPRKPHFVPKAKRVIFLCMRGGPSHVDTFDYKPKLKVDEGKPGLGRRGPSSRSKLMASPWEFGQHGQNGMRISELFPNVAKHADKLCLLNGMHTDLPAHPQAFVKMHTGNSQFVRPSLGAWTCLLYTSPSPRDATLSRMPAYA